LKAQRGNLLRRRGFSLPWLDHKVRQLGVAGCPLFLGGCWLHVRPFPASLWDWS
jgi:hypothetical protein